MPKRLLPKEYGGDGGTVDSIINKWEKQILAYRDYYKEEEENFGVDEAKRAGVKKNSGTLFGVDGTFRRLEID